MTHVKKICLMLGVCISVSSVSPCLAGLHAEAAEMPGIQEIVDANNFVAYCDLYDSIYMDYQSKRDPCKAYYTDADGTSFYIKYNDANEFEVVTPDYAVSSNGANGKAEYFLFRRSSDELMYRMSVAPEPRPRALLSSYISNVDTDEYTAFFEDANNFIVEPSADGILWTIDYSHVDWLEGKDVYLLDPDTLTCREFTYYDENGTIISRWDSEFDIAENPVPDTVPYQTYTEPSETVTVELYSSNTPDTPLKSWEVAADSTVSVYGETVYTDAKLRDRFDGKLGTSGVQKLYIQENTLQKTHQNIFVVLGILTAGMVLVAFLLEKLLCLKFRKTGI